MKSKAIISAIFMTLATLTASAQTQTFISESEKLILKFDPTAESITVPTMEDFGKAHGYLQGFHEQRGQDFLYGVWTVTKVVDEGQKKGYMMHLCNDFGSETQEAHFRQNSDSTWTLHLEGLTVIKRVQNNRKLVKIGSNLDFKKL